MQTVLIPPELTPNDNAEDLELLHRIAVYDHQAFETLYQRYAPRLSRYLQRFLPSHELVEDVIHDALLVVWGQASHYQGTGKVSTWIFGIARNKAFKARSRSVACSPTLLAETNTVESMTPEHYMAQQENQRLIRQALQTLPPVERQALVFTYEQGYTARAIASLQECSIGTVRYRLQQARRRLAAELR